MGADFTVNYECQPKLALGDKDMQRGTASILAMLKARNRAQAIGDLQREAGKDPREAKVTVVLRTPQGEKHQEVSYGEMMASAEPLSRHEAACAGCPANFLRTGFGCFGYLNYPVSADFERWLVDRLQPVDAPGGFLLQSAIKDFGYDGAPISRMRAAGMFELKTPPEKVIQKKLFGSSKVNGNQLFQALFQVGPALEPSHCVMILFWLGALEIEGRAPKTMADLPLVQATMAASTPEARRATARLIAGFDDQTAQHGRAMITALYQAWVLGVPLLMDA